MAPQSGTVLISSAYYPANQYNVGAHVRLTYFDKETREFIAYAVRLGDIIASGTGTSEFAATNALQGVLLEMRDSAGSAPKAA